MLNLWLGDPRQTWDPGSISLPLQRWAFDVAKMVYFEAMWMKGAVAHD